MIYEAYRLSIESGFNGATCNYAVVADYCDRYALDRIEVWRAVKSMLAAHNREIAQKSKAKGKR
jgi:hypothetical protein